MIFTALSWLWEQLKDRKSTLVLSVLVPVIVLKWWRAKSRKEVVLPPPGPWGLPLIGNLPFLDLELHRYFAKLSLRYGSILKIQLGSKSCVVFSSPEVAKDVLKDPGANFADHDIPAVGAVCAYGGIDTAFSPYGENVRMMRKICVSQLLRPRNLEALYGLRQREIRDTVTKVHSQIGSSIDIGEHVAVAMFNIITSMMCGNTLNGDERLQVTTKVREVVRKMVAFTRSSQYFRSFPCVGPI